MYCITVTIWVFNFKIQSYCIVCKNIKLQEPNFLFNFPGMSKSMALQIKIFKSAKGASCNFIPIYMLIPHVL